MSRQPIRTFLIQARKALQQSIYNKSFASFVIGNESADLDSITCALLYGYVVSSRPQSRKTGEIVIPVTNIPSADLRLRPELTALLRHADLKPADLITLDDLTGLIGSLPPKQTSWTLVDHNALQGALGEEYSGSVVGTIDHHADESKVPKVAVSRIIEKSGSCGSLVANFCRDTWDTISSSSSTVGAANGQDDGAVDDFAFTSTWDAQVAKLALGSILIDTVNLTDESKVTEHDRKAVKYLEARVNVSPKYGKTYDRDAFFEEINTAKSNLDDLSVEDILRKDYKEWHEGDISLGISSCVQPIEYLKSRTDDLLPVVIKYARSRKLQLFAIMTAYNNGGNFQRQLVLMSLAEGKPVEASERFLASNNSDLQLSDNKALFDTDEGLPLLCAWEQGNLSASRKQVAPMLREAITF